jgi:NAD(P)-dependent dehydrogenase (short-subunit alcohol dehydrogenase family)
LNKDHIDLEHHIPQLREQKNRLVESLAWELVEKEIKSIGTNPGPVHSDRIYKTVYPKAAAEFLRIGGFKELTNKQIEYATTELLPFLGEQKETIESECLKVATNLLNENKDTEHSIQDYKETLSSLLDKVQEIAEKVQHNTKKMIVDEEFLSQEDVAEMTFTLASDSISKLINGKIIPNDRVFYPVKPIISRNLSLDYNLSPEGKLILITTTTNNKNDILIIKKIAQKLHLLKTRQIIILTHKNEISQAIQEELKEFHHHDIDFENEEIIKKIFNTIETHFGKIDSTIHFTGDYDYYKDITKLTRKEWEKLVNQFILIPHLVVRESVLSITTKDALTIPAKFKDSFGNITIVGPSSPKGRKIDGKTRARSEIFRGALRPYITTANQELQDVLNSKINLSLIFQGSLDGSEPNYERLENSLITMCSQKELKNNKIIYLDE